MTQPNFVLDCYCDQSLCLCCDSVGGVLLPLLSEGANCLHSDCAAHHCSRSASCSAAALKQLQQRPRPQQPQQMAQAPRTTQQAAAPVRSQTPAAGQPRLSTVQAAKHLQRLPCSQERGTRETRVLESGWAPPCSFSAAGGGTGTTCTAGCCRAGRTPECWSCTRPSRGRRCCSLCPLQLSSGQGVPSVWRLCAGADCDWPDT